MSSASLTAPEALLHADYNPIAGFYRKHWCSHYHRGLVAMVERLLLCNISPGSRILDVCCGTGLVARYLTERGFRVTGVDASAEMLAFARAEVPEGDFRNGDARCFVVPEEHAGAICTFDSLSYMLMEEDLGGVFGSVSRALRPGGIFLFDLSLEGAYRSEWGRECAIVEEGEAHFVRGSYDPLQRMGTTHVTSFVRNGSWNRVDTTFLARCHDPESVADCLRRSGFVAVEWQESDRDDRLLAELGPGRASFLASKEK
ncbi:MAG: methyltransferase domain-containing protein [Bryobacterales bacterium]|nr:methyltransferase domain-containing protein [Bryobacterales bacterium]